MQIFPLVFQKVVQSSYSAKNLSVEIVISIKCIWKNHLWSQKIFSTSYSVCKAHSTSPFQNFTKMSKRVWLVEVCWYDFSGVVKSLCLLTSLFINSKIRSIGLVNGSPTNFLLDYLTFRKQRTKVGSTYSKWSNFRRGIPEGSLLGLILFNIFINDIFMIIEQSAICNFADDNTLYSWQEWLTEVTENLIFYTKGISYWFIPFSPVLCRSL